MLHRAGYCRFDAPSCRRRGWFGGRWWCLRLVRAHLAAGCVVVESHRGPGSPLSHGGGHRPPGETAARSASASGTLVPCITHDRPAARLRLHRRRPIPLPASRNSGTEASMGPGTGARQNGRADVVARQLGGRHRAARAVRRDDSGMHHGSGQHPVPGTQEVWARTWGLQTRMVAPKGGRRPDCRGHRRQGWRRTG
jgi:hypothetical protein